MKTIKLLPLLGMFLLSMPVHALMIGSGDSFTIDWLVDLDDNLTTSDLTATSFWTVTSYSSSSVVLDISITNTTTLDPGVLDNAAILSFGFGVSPDATATLSSPGSVFSSIGTGSGKYQSFPGGYKGIDVCLFSQGCSGGDVKTGLQAGDTDSLQLTLAPISGSFGSTLDLLFFPAKFQTSLGSFEPSGTVPEPAITALLGFGMLGVFVAGRLRRRR